ARALLGPPPVEPACGIPASGRNPLAEKPSVRKKPSNEAPSAGRGAEIKASRKVVLERFRQHLDETEEVTDEVPTEIRQVLGERGRMTPDLILGEAEPYELL